MLYVADFLAAARHTVQIGSSSPELSNKLPHFKHLVSGIVAACKKEAPPNANAAGIPHF
jgi:hypothetical protein